MKLPGAMPVAPSSLPSFPSRGAFLLMLASGFAGLGYQIVWTQQSALWLGHEGAAVLAVVTAFFGGLALGALLLGQRIERSAQPARWYAACEAVIGLWSLALAALMAPVSAALLGFTGAQPSAAWQSGVAFVGTFLLLLPATVAMGATLPAMERVLALHRPLPQGDSAPAPIAALYATNTLGALLGVLAAAFWLVPEFGLVRTATLCATLNVVCALVALGWRAGAGPVSSPSVDAPPWQPQALLAATGLLGIAYEVLVVRVISQVTENTVYTFAILLAVYLVGTALGAAAYQRWLVDRPGQDADRLRDRLLALLAAACLVGSASLWAAEWLRDAVQQTLGGGMAAALAAEATLAAASFALPTLMMGAVFSHLSLQARAAGIGFGRALGVNTLGAAAAPWVFGVGLLPAFGAKAALLVVVLGILALSLWRGWRAPATWAVVAAAAGLALWAPPLVFVDVPEGGRIVSYREGAMAAVSVIEDADGVLRLRIDNRQQEGSSATRLADARQAWLPLLLHPAPRRALFLGLGTGVTASSAAEDPTLQVEAVELLPEVIAASALFAPDVAAGERSPSTPPRLQVVAADARRFVRTSTARYDVIVSDNFHPARSGSGALYTVEHFAAVQARLAEGGLFCQWLPLHQMDLDTLRSIVQAFMAVHPEGAALLATNSLQTPVLGLVARQGGGRFDLGRLRGRLADPALRPRLAELGLADDFALLGGWVAGPRALARLAGDAPLNTDDRPVVAYRAPRITYAPDSLPRDRLLALLSELDVAPDELFDAGPDRAWLPRLAAYWAARDQFLAAGREVRPSADVQAMLAQVREPLLAVLRTSADFSPAYDPLLRMAMVWSRSDAAAARALLDELQRLRPVPPAQSASSPQAVATRR